MLKKEKPRTICLFIMGKRICNDIGDDYPFGHCSERGQKQVSNPKQPGAEKKNLGLACGKRDTVFDKGGAGMVVRGANPSVAWRETRLGSSEVGRKGTRPPPMEHKKVRQTG